MISDDEISEICMDKTNLHIHTLLEKKMHNLKFVYFPIFKKAGLKN